MFREKTMKRFTAVTALSLYIIAMIFNMPTLGIAGEKTDSSLRFICSQELLRVEFDIVGRHYSGKVNCGNLFLQTDIPNAPLVTFQSAKSDKLYTLMMIDADGNAYGSWPDPVSPGKNSPLRHWIVGNIPGEILRNGYLEQKGNTQIRDVNILEPYRYPHIPGVSDRYGLFVFEQEKRIEFAKLPDSIINFSYNSFIDKYKLGEPKASNYFIAIYTSASPFSGKPFHGNDVLDTWHEDYGKGRLIH